jgi:hypothetical protein
MTRLSIAALALGVFAMPAAAAADPAQVKRGAYIVTTHACEDCHTPLKMGPSGPEPDKARNLSGHPEKLVLPPPPHLTEAWNNAGSATNTAFVGPWGISYAVNLTPDPETGIGKWREKDFVQAIKTGKHLGVGRPIQPPMPWEYFRNLTEADLKAVFAYLQSIPPIRNRVPDIVPPAGK